MKTDGRKCGFTLAEAVVGSTIALVVIASALTVLIHSLNAVRNGMATYMLSRDARLAREGILRGMGTGDGLKEGRWSSFQVTAVTTDVESVSFRVETNKWPTDSAADDVSYSIADSTGLNYSRTEPAGGASNIFDIIFGTVELAEMDCTTWSTSTGDFVTVRMVLSITTGGREYTRTQTTKTRIVNQ